MNNLAIRPWYRHPLVWMVIAIPFSAVIMGVVMIWLAVTTDDGLVEDDYYKQGKAINLDLRRDAVAQEQGISAVFEMDNSEGWMNLNFNKGKLQAYPDTLHMKLQYATHNHNDVEVVLNRGQGEQYIGLLKQPLHKGKWYLELYDGEWRLNGQLQADQRITVNLEP
ncbi:MAG: FixH family protein [Gammaproteobacteria bacterium]|nr:FixH family protein [Gammaproteobacteria bacterium]